MSAFTREQLVVSELRRIVKDEADIYDALLVVQILDKDQFYIMRNQYMGIGLRTFGEFLAMWDAQEDEARMQSD